MDLNSSSVSENKKAGIAISDDSGVAISNSHIENNKGGGIWIVGSSDLKLSSTEISGNEILGLWVKESPQLVLKDNFFAENKGFGILVNKKMTDTCPEDVARDFTGSIQGSDNKFKNNGAGAKCPDLDFLETATGGEYDKT